MLRVAQLLFTISTQLFYLGWNVLRCNERTLLSSVSGQKPEEHCTDATTCTSKIGLNPSFFSEFGCPAWFLRTSSTPQGRIQEGGRVWKAHHHGAVRTEMGEKMAQPTPSCFPCFHQRDDACSCANVAYTGQVIHTSTRIEKV